MLKMRELNPLRSVRPDCLPLLLEMQVAVSRVVQWSTARRAFSTRWMCSTVKSVNYVFELELH